MNARRQVWMRELHDSLSGPRRARRRLLHELAAHVEDAVAEEVANGASHEQAEATALERLGPADEIGRRWSADASSRVWTARVRILASSLVLAAVVAPVGLAQRSGERPSQHVRQPARPGHVATHHPRPSTH